MSQICINVDKPQLLTGPSIILHPIVAKAYGMREAAVLSHLSYLCNKSNLKMDGAQFVRASYTKIQLQLPFLSKKTVLNVIKRLKEKNLIEVDVNSGINRYFVSDPLEKFVINEAAVFLPESCSSNLLLFPLLAQRIGLKEALILQQIHIRCYQKGGDHWVLRTFDEWQSSVFIFMDRSNMIKSFNKLRQQGLIYVRNYANETGHRNGYRVNYEKLASSMNLEINLPKISKLKGWLNPLTPNLKLLKKNQLQWI